MGVRQKALFFTTKLTLRPIISNIGTATYEIARYLAELLAPLGKSKHTISNTKYFITRLKTEKFKKGLKLFHPMLRVCLLMYLLKRPLILYLTRFMMKRKLKHSFLKIS